MTRFAGSWLLAGLLLTPSAACSVPSDAASAPANVAAPIASANATADDSCTTAPARRQAVAQAADPARIQQVTRVTGPLRSRVMDRAEVLNPDQEKIFVSRSEQLEAATTDQLVVVTVPDLAGLTIEQFGLTLGNHWGIGRADLDNGVMILVAPSERKVRIEVGCGLEPILTDEGAARIVQLMLPSLAAGDYSGGIAIGLREIASVLRDNPGRGNAS